MNNSILDNLMLSYSSIIGPEDYNHIMTNEHLYINTADRFIAKFIADRAAAGFLHVTELGSGPARLARSVAQTNNIALTAVDIDPVFCEYAEQIARQNNFNINVICSDATSYKASHPVDIFYSQGFHHHVQKGAKTEEYLSNIYNQLSENGYYILSDEFIPNYIDNNDRNIKLVAWYSHIIAHALKNDYKFLAIEEAKTLLDDLQEGSEEKGFKSQEQIDLVLSYAKTIDQATQENLMPEAESIAKKFLSNLADLCNTSFDNLEKEMYLSRRDYKICDLVLKNEAEKVGFIVEKCRSFGPIDKVGGMSVYILRK